MRFREISNPERNIEAMERREKGLNSSSSTDGYINIKPSKGFTREDADRVFFSLFADDFKGGESDE